MASLVVHVVFDTTVVGSIVVVPSVMSPVVWHVVALVADVVSSLCRHSRPHSGCVPLVGIPSARMLLRTTDDLHTTARAPSAPLLSFVPWPPTLMVPRVVSVVVLLAAVVVVVRPPSPPVPSSLLLWLVLLLGLLRYMRLQVARRPPVKLADLSRCPTAGQEEGRAATR